MDRLVILGVLRKDATVVRPVDNEGEVMIFKIGSTEYGAIVSKIIRTIRNNYFFIDE